LPRQQFGTFDAVEWVSFTPSSIRNIILVTVDLDPYLRPEAGGEIARQWVRAAVRPSYGCARSAANQITASARLLGTRSELSVGSQILQAEGQR
jgi:hypothetical protein